MRNHRSLINLATSKVQICFVNTLELSRGMCLNIYDNIPTVGTQLRHNDWCTALKKLIKNSPIKQRNNLHRDTKLLQTWQSHMINGLSCDQRTKSCDQRTWYWQFGNLLQDPLIWNKVLTPFSLFLKHNEDVPQLK